ncbi:SDR family oxidoreductase [Pontibacter sp. G13]|uniref:enoyl-ACP reductase FabI n=1 Tax=Pontibacter sp. G13 TaxID=3074898 RepID=UPI00288C0B25|nr:SDR family oxidoreductase [Pontibacter sp. G13]WNJ18654.1 SDR family oxidoreductase [Pontibacter sp. G13]
MAHQLLEGKKGIIFGALDEMSIAWKVAEKAHAEGAEILLTNAPVALRMGKINELAEKTNAQVVPADATSLEDIGKLLDAAEEQFGKVDFVLHAIGMSVNVRKKREYTNLNYDWLNKGYDVSAISFHKILQSLYQRDLMNEWGSIVALSYIAAQRTFSKYSDMAEAKALLESIARSFGYHYGNKKNVRINTISQSPTPTTAGQGIKGFQKMLDYGAKMSPLGNATADDCADYCLSLFSDYTRKVTMQNLFHDGGFSSMGIADAMMIEDEE